MHYKKTVIRLLALLLICVLLACGCTAGKQGQYATDGDAVATDGNAVEVIAVSKSDTAEVDAALPAAVFPVNEPTGAADETVVSTVDELLAAIGSDRTIYLQPGVYELTTAKGYGQPTTHPNYKWVETYDGYWLMIYNVRNLSIVGRSAADVTINTVPRYADVIGFSECEGISVRGVTAGHAEEPGACTGAVLYLEATSTVSVDDCDLYGCGTLGLSIWDCRDVTAKNCTIRDCSLGGMWVVDSKNVLLQDSRIVNCGDAASPAECIFSFAQSGAVAVVNCAVQGNTARTLLGSAYCQNVDVLGSTFQSNTITESAFSLTQYSPVVEGCAFSDNTVSNWYAPLTESGEATVQAVSKADQSLTEQDLLRMQQADIPYEAPLSAPDNGPSPTPVITADGMREVRVSTVDELLAAIGSDTTVYLADGVYDLSKAGNYGAYGGDAYHWEDVFDGPGLILENLTNFHIIGNGADKAFIHAIPRYADVLSYRSCENVSIAGVTLGHSEAPGECCGGVLRFAETDTVSIRDCGLFGCGIFGVDATDCRAFTVEQTEIYDCSVYGVALSSCKDMAFTGCNIRDCGEPMFRANRCENVTVDGKAVESTQY